MLFLAWLASWGTPNVTWMLIWLGLGFVASDRSPLTFVFPFLATLLGHPEVAVAFFWVVWLLEFADIPLFSSKEHGKGRINTALARLWKKPAPASAALEEIAVEKDESAPVLPKVSPISLRKAVLKKKMTGE